MLNKKKKTTTPTFEERMQVAKYERIYQTLKDILKLEIKVVDKVDKEEIDFASTCSAMKTKARLAIDFVADLEKDDEE